MMLDAEALRTLLEEEVAVLGLRPDGAPVEEPLTILDAHDIEIARYADYYLVFVGGHPVKDGIGRLFVTTDHGTALMLAMRVALTTRVREEANA